MILRGFGKLLTARLAESSPLIQVLIGPRQVGKSTALAQVIDANVPVHSADSPTPLATSLLEQWWSEAEAHPSRLLVIDEIQKIAGWSEVIKKLWDSSERLKVVLTGSSSLLVQKGLKESLAGRFELLRAEHWNWQEAQQEFACSFEDFIEFGCYPGSMNFFPDRQRWGDYVRDSIIEPVLGRDLLQLHPIDNPALLRAIFGVAASLPAQIISLQKLLGQLQMKGSVPTISHYLKLLGEAFLVSMIQKFSGSPFAIQNSSPKLIIHDNALCRALMRPVDKNISSELRGHYLENAVGARLIEAGWDLFYWRERNLEVDFVALGPDGEKLAIEVKLQAPAMEELKGLKKFIELYSDFTPCMVLPSDARQPPGYNVLIVPAERLLSASRSSPLSKLLSVN